jgi:crossover junction endodeoxyribonuclease RuvC
MNVLALDLGTTTGWARCSRDGTVTGGSETFSPSKCGGRGQRWIAFRQFLSDQRNAAGEIQVVYYEDIKMHKGVLAAHAYGGFKAMLEAWCAANNVRMVGQGFGIIKKHWTGKGNADKDLMVATARAKGFAVVDDNHADALAILALARHLEGK